jgi:hypothetical protein
LRDNRAQGQQNQFLQSRAKNRDNSTCTDTDKKLTSTI